MTTKGEDLTAVIELACLTEDRTDNEQRALLRICRWVDKEANENTVGNHRMWGDHAGSDKAVRQLPPSNLEQLAHQTRDVSDFPGDKQHEVTLPDRNNRQPKPAKTAPPPSLFDGEPPRQVDVVATGNLL